MTYELAMAFSQNICVAPPEGRQTSSARILHSLTSSIERKSETSTSLRRDALKGQRDKIERLLLET